MTTTSDGSLKLRPARPVDEPQVAALCRALDPEDWLIEVFPEWAARADGTLHVADLAGQVVGLVGFTLVKPGEAYLMGMRVSPSHRRLGIGKALTLHVTEQAFQAGARVARLTTRRDNLPAQALLASAGYRRMGPWDIVDAWNWVGRAMVRSWAGGAAGQAAGAQEQAGDQEASGMRVARVRQGHIADLVWLWPWLQQRNQQSVPGGIIAQPGEAFEVQSLNEDDFRRYLAEGQVWLAVPGAFDAPDTDNAALALVEQDGEGWILRQFAGSPPAARQLLLELDRQIRASAVPQVDVSLPGKQFSLLVEVGLGGFEGAHWPGYIYQKP